MRVKELSELAGTTVRAVRHYHQVGLLDVPNNDGMRDYNFSHLVRLTRIRFLAESGLSLTQIKRVLQEGEGANSEDRVVAELHRAEVAIDDAIARLQLQKRMLRRLHSSQCHVEIPMPERVSRFYDSLANLEPPPTPAVLDLLMQERQIMELLARTHVLDSWTDFFPLDMTETQSRSLISLCESFLELGNHHPDLHVPSDRRYWENRVDDDIRAHLETTKEQFAIDLKCASVRPLVLQFVQNPVALRLLCMAFPHPLQRLYVQRFITAFFSESVEGQEQ